MNHSAYLQVTQLPVSLLSLMPRAITRTAGGKEVVVKLISAVALANALSTFRRDGAQRCYSRFICDAQTPLIFLGAAAGLALTLSTTQPKLDGAHAQAAAAGTYRKLSLFGEVFERVHANYVEKPDNGKLISSAINGMLSGIDPHSGSTCLATRLTDPRQCDILQTRPCQPGPRCNLVD